MRVDEGEQVSAQSIAQAHHGIAGEHFKRLMFEAFGLAGFAFAGDEFVATAGIQSSGGMAHFVGIAGDDAADGGGAGQGEVLLLTPGLQQDVQFGFAKVGEWLAQLSNCLDQRRWRLRLSPVPGRAGLGAQGRRVAAGLAQGLFLAIKGSATETEGITGRRFAMIREETEDVEALLSLFGSPLPKMP